MGFDIKRKIIYVPSYRNDISSQNDLSEEVARVIGYDNILIHKLTYPREDASNKIVIENKLRFLLDHGFYEVINNPFVSIKVSIH